MNANDRSPVQEHESYFPPLMEGAQPFLYPGNEIGCLLIHGFTGSPADMHWMGLSLAEHGFTTLGVRLFGHGTKPQDMNRARWQDWLASALDGYHMLRESCSRLFVIGLSMGGALSLILAADHDVDGLMLMATPYQSPDERLHRMRPIVPLLSRFVPTLKKGTGSDWHNPEARGEHVAYDVYPLRAAAEMDDLLAHMRLKLLKVQSPCMLVYSHADGTVPEEDGEKILKRIATPHKSLRWVENSGHNISLDSAREQVLAWLLEFIHGGVP
jgi:carboxylesterase